MIGIFKQSWSTKLYVVLLTISQGVELKSRGHYLGIAQIAFATPLPALKSAPKRQIIPDKSAPKRQIQARVKTPPKSNKGVGGGMKGSPNQSHAGTIWALPK